MAEATLLIDAMDYQEELQVATEPLPKKQRQLRKREVIAICWSTDLSLLSYVSTSNERFLVRLSQQSNLLTFQF